MGRDGGDDEGLQADVGEEERAGHGRAGGEAGFAVEVARGGEVVEGGF